jgi:hypothetical protein
MVVTIFSSNNLRMRQERHTSTNGEMTNPYKSLWERQKERDHWEDPDVGGRIILKSILEK